MTSSTAQEIYDRLWAEATVAFARSEAQIDPYLAQPDTDRRMGITLIARLDQEVLAGCSDLIHELAEQEPEQYFYRPDELHVTMLSLVSASAAFDIEMAPIGAYHALFAELFQRLRPFTIAFKGITASPGTVMLQGYVENDQLNLLRETLRQELDRAGLGQGLDLRYRSVTAHATLMRFRSQPRDLAALAERLALARNHDFGCTLVNTLNFVVNDWYMSHDRVRTLATYVLGESQ